MRSLLEALEEAEQQGAVLRYGDEDYLEIETPRAGLLDHRRTERHGLVVSGG